MRSAENVCGCAKYECGEWGGGGQGGRAGWATQGWASQPGAGRGAGLLPTVTTLLAHPVKAPVCLSRELGVMQPGQMVVELSADGVCHTSRCTDVLDPLTSFYQINTTSVLCDVHCEAVGGGGWGPGELGVSGALQARPSSLDKSREWAWWETFKTPCAKCRGQKGIVRVQAWQGWTFDRENTHLLSTYACLARSLSSWFVSLCCYHLLSACICPGT